MLPCNFRLWHEEDIARSPDVRSIEDLAAFNDEFGGTAVNAPSTPHWFITADGKIGDLKTGKSSADDILAELGVA